MPKVELDQIPAKQWNQALRRERGIAPLISRARVSEREVEEAADKLNLSRRQRLFAFPTNRYAFAELLENLSSPEAEKFKRRLATWPPTLRTLVFQAQSTQ